MTVRRGLLAAATTGVALALASPPWDHGWLAWGALVPLVLATEGRSPWAAGALGWLAGTVWQAVGMTWLVGTLDYHTGLPLPAVLALWLGTAAFLGLFVGMSLACAAWASRRGWPRALALPVAWMALEGVQGWPLGAFPWMPLGLSQHAIPGIAAWAATIGTVGLSGLLVLTNVVLAGAVATVQVRAAWRWPAAATAAAAVVALVAGGATGRAGDAARAGEAVLRLGLVQGHVAPKERANPYTQGRVLRRYERLSAQVAPAADLLLWPEAAVPFYFGSDVRATRRIRAVARRHARPLLFGSAAVERLTPTTRRYTNRAVLLDADGSVGATYTKRRLVPFGETVPFGRWLPVGGPFIGTPQSLEPGAGPAVVTLRDGTRAGLLLCFETIFPALARAAVAGGARLLVNLANDGWFPDAAGSAQALAHARLRAIELGVPVVRVANEGPSAVIDSAGRIVWAAADGQMLAEVVAVAVPARAAPTLYARGAAWMPGARLVALAVLLAVPVRRRAAA